VPLRILTSLTRRLRPTKQDDAPASASATSAEPTATTERPQSIFTPDPVYDAPRDVFRVEVFDRSRIPGLK
jgi:hypothetical protein